MPYTVVIAVPEPTSTLDNIELELIQAFYIEESEDFGGWYAGYKPAIVRKLGIENIDVYYIGCYKDEENWSSYYLFGSADDDSYLNIPNAQLPDFRSVCEKLLMLSKIGRIFMILHNGVSVVDNDDVSYSQNLPSERYVDYDLRYISFDEFLSEINNHSTKFKIESIWEIY